MALEEFLGISNDKLLTSFAETLYMVGIALIIVTIVAFVLAIVLIFTRKGGLYQNVVIYNIINVIINIVRSTPFVVLLVAIMPVTKFLIGTRIGATAAIVPLTVNAIPLLTRLFENSLLDTGNGILEAALAMGATPLQLVTKFILPESLGSVICIRIGVEDSRHLFMRVPGVGHFHEINARAPGPFAQPLVEAVLTTVAVAAPNALTRSRPNPLGSVGKNALAE